MNVDIRNKLPPDAVVFDNYAYDNSIIGVTFDGRAIYCFEDMVKELMKEEGWEELGELAAIEWIEYNAMRALPYAGEKAPIVVNAGY